MTDDEKKAALAACLKGIENATDGSDARAWAEAYATLMGWKNTTASPWWPTTYSVVRPSTGQGTPEFATEVGKAIEQLSHERRRVGFAL